MLHPRYIVAGFLGLCLVGLIFADPSQLSLASDVGLTDQTACDAIQKHSRTAIDRLEASGFPHASTLPVERYALVSQHETKMLIEIDWTTRTGHCTQASVAPTATFTMNPGAYADLVVELRSVIETGDFTSGKIAHGTSVLFGTTITDAEGEKIRGYGWKLARWTLGQLNTDDGGEP